MVRETAVSVVFYFLEGNSPKYLLLKYNIYGQKHWDFIKGRMEKGEGIEETAKREAFEEARIRDFKIVPDFKLESKYSYKKNTGQKVNKKIIYLLSKFPKSKVKKITIGKEHKKFEWVDYNKAKKLLQFKNQRKIIKKINSFIIKNL